MNNYQLEVVAEKGTLQKRLGLTPVERTATSNFPKGKLTIRTTRVPSPNDLGGYALYYNDNNDRRAVCHVGASHSWTGNGQQKSKDLYYHFNSGCIKSKDFLKFVDTIVAIENNVDRVLRRGESLDNSRELL
jgi:hypothetical protein